MRPLLAAILILIPALAGPARLAAGQPGEILVFAAASSAPAIEALGAAFGRDGLGRVVVSGAASSTLARQIENGAPAQIYISADEDWADRLAAEHFLVEGSRVDLLGNRLVLAAPADKQPALVIGPGFPLAAALDGGCLATGDPDHVPVGLYAKAALTYLGVWKDVEPRILRAESVRAALAFIERGECPLGIVYESDVVHDPKVRVVGIFPEDSHPPIRYPAALVEGHAGPPARAFLAYLRRPAAAEIFRSFGFAPP